MQDKELCVLACAMNTCAIWGGENIFPSCVRESKNSLKEDFKNFTASLILELLWATIAVRSSLCVCIIAAFVVRAESPFYGGRQWQLGKKVNQNACDWSRACGVTTENSAVFDFPWHHCCAEPACRLPSVHQTTTSASWSKGRKSDTLDTVLTVQVLLLLWVWRKMENYCRKWVKFSGLEIVPIHQTDAQQLEVASRVCC